MEATLAVLTEDPRLEADAARFHQALESLTRVLRFRDRDCICCHDLSVTQCDALTELVRHGPLTMNELAGRLYLDKSTASRVVGSLERKGYSTRAQHPSDGRAVQLGATSAGRKLFLRIERDLLTAEKQLLSEFDAPVRAAATSLIGKLAQAAAGRVDASGGSCCRIE